MVGRAVSTTVKVLERLTDIRFMAIAALAVVAGTVVIVGCLKGRYALSIVGLFILLGIPAILAAVRVARDDSWWAKRFYGEDKLRQSAHRYPGNSHLNDAFTL
jgi:hypothetical protein